MQADAACCMFRKQTNTIMSDTPATSAVSSLLQTYRTKRASQVPSAEDPNVVGAFKDVPNPGSENLDPKGKSNDMSLSESLNDTNTNKGVGNGLNVPTPSLASEPGVPTPSTLKGASTEALNASLHKLAASAIVVPNSQQASQAPSQNGPKAATQQARTFYPQLTDSVVAKAATVTSGINAGLQEANKTQDIMITNTLKQASSVVAEMRPEERAFYNKVASEHIIGVNGFSTPFEKSAYMLGVTDAMGARDLYMQRMATKSAAEGEPPVEIPEDGDGATIDMMLEILAELADEGLIDPSLVTPENAQMVLDQLIAAAGGDEAGADAAMADADAAGAMDDAGAAEAAAMMADAGAGKAASFGDGSLTAKIASVIYA